MTPYPSRTLLIDSAVILALLGYGYAIVNFAALVASSRHAMSVTYTYDPAATDPAWVDLPAVDTDGPAVAGIDTVDGY